MLIARGRMTRKVHFQKKTLPKKSIKNPLLLFASKFFIILCLQSRIISYRKTALIFQKLFSSEFQVTFSSYFDFFQGVNHKTKNIYLCHFSVQ